jgi:pilus assembly protein Flp/PilA
MVQLISRSLPARLRVARRDEAGVTAIEYALMVAGIAAAIVSIVFLLGADVANIFDVIHEKIVETKECAQAHQNCGKT